MADAISSASGSLASLVQTTWSPDFSQNLNDNIAFNSIVSYDAEGMFSMGGTVKLPTLADVEAVNLSEGGKADAQVASASSTSLTINRRAVADFIVTDQSLLQSVSYMTQLQEIATKALARAIQDYIISIIAPSTSSPDHTIAYDSGTTLADADILECLDLARAANWPDSDLHMVMGSAQYNDALNISKLYDQTLGGVASTSQGKLTGNVYGFAPHWTTAVGTNTYMFHSSFMQVAVQQGVNIKVDSLSATGQRAYRVSADVLYGATQQFNTRVISLS